MIRRATVAVTQYSGTLISQYWRYFSSRYLWHFSMISSFSATEAFKRRSRHMLGPGGVQWRRRIVKLTSYRMRQNVSSVQPIRSSGITRASGSRSASFTFKGSLVSKLCSVMVGSVPPSSAARTSRMTTCHQSRLRISVSKGVSPKWVPSR